MSGTELDYFHFEKGRPSFEDLGRQNGFRYWFARDLVNHPSLKGEACCKTCLVDQTKTWSPDKALIGLR